MLVKTTRTLRHPFNKNAVLTPGKCGKDVLIQDLGQINYDFAVEKGWVVELEEEAK